MQVKIRLREDQESFLVPEILVENFRRLFREFDLSEEEINKIHIFMDFKDELGADGYYLGKKGNKHFIQLDSRLLNNRDDLNLTIIHEARHLYWNIVELGNVPRLTRNYGLLLNRYPHRSFIEQLREEINCTKIEKLYFHIVLLETFYISQVLDNFYNPSRQLSLPFFTL